MIGTANPNVSLRFVTTTAGNVKYAGLYVDKGIKGASDYADFYGSVSSATTTTLFSGPSGSGSKTLRQLERVTFSATAAQTVQIVKTVGGTDYPLSPAVSLGAGESLVVVATGEMFVYTASGIVKNVNTVVGPVSTVLMARHFSTANLTSVKSITSNSSFAVYVGRAPRALTSVSARYRVTTAMATITWGEIALAKGAVNVGGNPTLTVVGYTDVSAIANSTGQKTTTINVSSGQTVAEGDDLWFVVGNQATTACVLRAQSIADDLQVGLQASLATRPSTIVGSSGAWTIEGATTLAPWVALVA